MVLVRFVFYMMGRPPSPTHFPYTTLFRSRGRFRARRVTAGEANDPPSRTRAWRRDRAAPRPPADAERRAIAAPGTRSEEHTSELQSRRDLVCRLLLEKKNTKMTRNHKTQE